MMAGIGIGVSDREPTHYGCEYLPRPTHRIDPRLQEARDAALAAWQKVNGDFGENLMFMAYNARVAGDHESADAYYAELQELIDAARAADVHAHRVYVQVFECKHRNTHYEGRGVHMSDGEPVDDIRLVCDDCGNPNI